MLAVAGGYLAMRSNRISPRDPQVKIIIFARAKRFVKSTRRIEHHEPWLTLHGLRLIFEKNQ